MSRTSVERQSRTGTVGITFHWPAEVRKQLKALAVDEGRHMHDMAAEAVNMLFARYQRPEIAPRDVPRSDS